MPLVCFVHPRPKALAGYGVNFNKRHNRHGHLCQNRYKSNAFKEEVYLRELVMYIHTQSYAARIIRPLPLGMKQALLFCNTAMMVLYKMLTQAVSD